MFFQYVLAFALFGFLCLAPHQGEPLQYTLVFSDEFNTSTINAAKWTVIDKPSDVNNELHYYSKDDVYVKDGYMTFRSQRRSIGGRQYSSGKVDSKGKFEFTYGEVEYRAKLPGGKGIWPALWLTSVGSWPPEIDVMELRGDIPTKITQTVHYGKYPNNHYNGYAYWGPNFTADFHTYKAIWDPNQVTFFVDGMQTFKVTDQGQIPHEPMRIIMNVAVGGDYSGNPDGSTPFPTYMFVDYVRVYRWQ